MVIVTETWRISWFCIWNWTIVTASMGTSCSWFRIWNWTIVTATLGPSYNMWFFHCSLVPAQLRDSYSLHCTCKLLFCLCTNIISIHHVAFFWFLLCFYAFHSCILHGAFQLYYLLDLTPKLPTHSNNIVLGTKTSPFVDNYFWAQAEAQWSWCGLFYYLYSICCLWAFSLYWLHVFLDLGYVLFLYQCILDSYCILFCVVDVPSNVLLFISCYIPFFELMKMQLHSCLISVVGRYYIVTIWVLSWLILNFDILIML